MDGLIVQPFENSHPLVRILAVPVDLLQGDQIRSQVDRCVADQQVAARIWTLVI
ncbi:MAG: hypothetical protein GKR89_28235 [Candidatus Latescibacteria bacterium]|nr:hypothetical protein [Candidatus Latescibacterota bacterium]